MHRNIDFFTRKSRSTVDIRNQIFASYTRAARLVPQWRLALTEPGQYARREVCTQFEESDLDFVSRLLADEGLFYWFEHAAGADGDAFGSHTLVIADSNAAFAPNVQPEIRFHRASAVEAADTITDWQALRQVTTNAVAVASWHAAQVMNPASQEISAADNGEIPCLTAIDHAGPMHFADQERAARSARLQLEALDARNKTYYGQGTVRTLSPGTTFVLAEHPVHDAAATFAVLSVKHEARNNLSSDAKTLIDQLFANSTRAAGADRDDAPLYCNRFTALRADIPWRPLMRDARGALLHPKPSVAGIHTAIVVGASGADLTTERDHRIKVQMHWQRGARSHSRLPHTADADNAPAWFAGGTGEHAHNAILAGFKTQEIGSSQAGSGGYNQLVFDDSTDQVGLRLQSTQHKSQLNLGHIKRQTDNARQQSHGHGAELTTEAFGAVRAGQGLLLSTDARPNANSSQLDVREALGQLTQAHDLHTNLAETAQKHRAHVGKDYDPEQHRFPEEVLSRPIASIKETTDGCGTPDGGGAGTVPAFGRPDVVLSSPAGIAMVTPADMHAAASAITVTGGIDVSVTAGRNLAAAVRSGLTLFTYGDAKAKRRDKGDCGIKLHAASGKVDVQAQSAELKAAADKDVHIASTQAKVEAAGKEHVLLTAGGAYIKIAGGSIQIHAPGSVLFKAGLKDISGPASASYSMPHMPKAEIGKSDIEFRHLTDWGEPIAGAMYKAILSDGSVRTGVLDEQGYARISGVPAGTSAKIEYQYTPLKAKSYVAAEIDEDLNDFLAWHPANDGGQA